MKRISAAVLCVFSLLVIAAPVAADDDRGHHRDYRDYRGYRERPYDKHRHYERYKHRGREYHYRGHWRSWDEWDRYARERDLYKHGRHYHEGGHLMFRFCDPDAGGCFFFSIGR